MKMREFTPVLLALPSAIPFFFGNVTLEQKIIIALAIFIACLVVYCISLNVKLEKQKDDNEKLRADFEVIKKQNDQEQNESNNQIKDIKTRHHALASVVANKNKALAEYETYLRASTTL